MTIPGYRSAVLAVAAIVALGLGLWVGGRLAGEHALPGPAAGAQATVLFPPRALAPFALLDQDRRAFDLERLEGKWTFLFFGYTHCPDVCPMTLATLGQAAARLAAAGSALEDTQFVFVSVDPARDSPEQLKAYVGHFNRDFLGVTGPDEQLQAFTRQLGVVYARPVEPGPEYAVDHSAAILLIDTEARLRAVLSTPHDAGKIAEAFLAIREREG